MKTVFQRLHIPRRRAAQPQTGELQAVEPLLGRADSESTLPPISITKRLVFIAVAGFFFLLGAAGVVLPGLPTTPFLLLTSYFLLRAWPSMNERLLRSRLFGGVLRDWQHRGGVRRHIKVKAIALVGVMVCAGLVFIEMLPMVRGIFASGALIGLLVIRRLPEVAVD